MDETEREKALEAIKATLLHMELSLNWSKRTQAVKHEQTNRAIGPIGRIGLVLVGKIRPVPLLKEHMRSPRLSFRLTQVEHLEHLLISPDNHTISFATDDCGPSITVMLWFHLPQSQETKSLVHCYPSITIQTVPREAGVVMRGGGRLSDHLQYDSGNDADDEGR
jgi:hypothetical protein